ncbi:hypothetical protein QOZ83_15465 [Romboutsia sedimentorum]|uniref:hypothetical protein n=1 Tax=Romboutsia sedimentorum TaxID=1368474 RepID=UPI0024DE1065|nr:hypothetical protein [Romboutsia sedimentorum]MDK2587245.1 hypothetical protein [Romboutsia sedimentorum]
MKDNILLKDKLTSEEKIKYILDLQDRGFSRKQIREDMGYKKTGNLTDLMKRYGYVVVNEKFIKGGERHPHDTDMQEKLFNMVNKYDKFIEVLDWYGRSSKNLVMISINIFQMQS